MSLKSFLKENAVKCESVKFVVSNRFKDDNGNPIAWELKVLDNKTMEDLREKCKKRVINKTTGTTEIITNNEQFQELLVVNSVIYPELGDAELQDSYGVVGAEDLVKAMLTPGEYADLFEACITAQGYETSMNDKVKAVKNS